MATAAPAVARASPMGCADAGGRACDQGGLASEWLADSEQRFGHDCRHHGVLLAAERWRFGADEYVQRRRGVLALGELDASVAGEPRLG